MYTQICIFSAMEYFNLGFLSQITGQFVILEPHLKYMKRKICIFF